MTLDNIQLPPFIIAGLFKDSLVALNTAQPKTDTGSAVVPAGKPVIAGLGQNGRHILILVHDENALYLQDERLDFLLGILAACKLSMADITLVNLANTQATYLELTTTFEAEKIFLFGADPAQIAMPIAFPFYQVQRYNNQVYLNAPSLAALENDRMEKSKLWTCLKQIFGI